MFQVVEGKTYSINEADEIIDEALKNGITTTNKKINYYNIVCAFDIETTSFTDDQKIKGDTNNKRATMYIWQLAIDGRVIIGRTWEEFILFIIKLENDLCLDSNNRLIIYIHNMNFEFQWIRHLFKWDKVFSIDTRKPIYAITTTGIEFRCSYILTNYSLAKLGAQLRKYNISKMDGDLDYSKLRHSLTPLTDTEMKYCINDVLVVSCYIQEQIEIEGDITKIPLTATGYCRRFVRHACLYSGGKKGRRAQYDRYHAKMLSMKIQGEEEYSQLKRAFQGGFTHASADYSSWTLKDIDSIDFTSSYPYALLSEEYPISSGKKVTIHSNEELQKYLKCYCCIFDVEFIGLRATFKADNYISASKCWTKTNAVLNNGRIVDCDICSMTITNVDFEIIKRTYKFEVAHIYNFRIYEKGYLPIEIIKSIIHFYKAKTELKGVKGKETEYLNGKALLNSVYGMMVTDIVKDEIVYHDIDEWGIEKANAEKLIESYNNSRKRFLFYPWGVFCTAYSRANLWAGILHFGDFNSRNDYVYSDTDSIKCRHIEEHFDYINAYNALCEKKLRKMCNFYGLDYEAELLPKTIEGEAKPLGVFDWETKDNKYEYFKTLGAKRYMVYQGGELSITVSGVNKKTAIPYLLDKYTIDECFEAFNFGLEIPAFATGKLTHYYLDNHYTGEITDYQGVKYTYDELSAIYLEPAEYSFDIAAEYIDYLKGYQYLRL